MTADKKRIRRMLRTARGQIDGILRMVEEDRYCIDISNQIMASQALMGRANAEILKSHVFHCVRHAMEHNDADKKLEEIAALLEKLTKN